MQLNHCVKCKCKLAVVCILCAQATMRSGFAAFPLSPAVQSLLLQQGFQQPTPVQVRACRMTAVRFASDSRHLPSRACATGGYDTPVLRQHGCVRRRLHRQRQNTRFCTARCRAPATAGGALAQQPGDACFAFLYSCILRRLILRLRKNAPRICCLEQVGAVIVSPTRELARQIFDVAKPFVATVAWLQAALLVGGT